MKSKNIAIIIIILLILITGFLLIRFNLTGGVVKDYYTYTKAICDENNFCQDYEITCQNKKLIEMKPITGASIQHSNSWEDPRENKSEILCE
jgi:hypothetical protein